MVLFYITGINPQKKYIECNFGDEDFETCLETISQLVRAGWRLYSVAYTPEGMNVKKTLPVAAFDGFSMREDIKKLQREWESILF